MRRDISEKKNSRTLDEALSYLIRRRLDEEPNLPQVKRVQRILDALLDLKECLGTVGATVPLTVLRGALRRYRWTNQIAVTSTKVRVGRIPLERLSEDGVWEYGAVNKLLELVQKPNGLDNFRRCKFCGKPLFVLKAKGRPREFCDNNNVCKSADEYRDPVKRERKLDYMKDYYKS